MTVLRFHNVSKTYQSESGNKTAALFNVSLEVRQGDFLAVVGPSGSGKSTLLHLMGGLDRPTGGDISFASESITRSFNDLSERELARLRGSEIGIMYQGFHLLPTMRAWENVALPLVFRKISLNERKKQAEELLEDLGLQQRLNHYPSQLSGGEQQRVALARAVISKPTLLLADEPTGNLDSVSADYVLDLLRTIHKRYRLATVIVTHDQRVADIASKTITIVDGRNYDRPSMNDSRARS
ncbi:ABC transporter ATP-binding protein [Geomonas nitrogeniifigens]|uniref:ABC transporter ATP-binding protein n=1 Tax=Geomonas diazotrophica TaxID=2843197 RepID=UPI001C2C3EFF|nr:ABC transporter ATP-binding protein [Geomonas nitrogeniifigens]QXE85523.1 ABC transporter ATP-binding protein [Geomonas nitrogeniifigens]